MFAAAPLVFAAGAIGVLYTMVGWWRDVIKEAEHKGDHTRVVQISHRYGMILFIASEVMFFVAWFWAYFSTALFPADAVHVARTELLGGVWPPKGIETFDPWHLPLLNTLILLTSGTTVTWAHHALLHDDREGPEVGPDLHHRARRCCSPACRPTNTATRRSSTKATSTARPSSWRPASTAPRDHRHDLPLVCLIRAYVGHFTPKQHLGFEFAAWYWHFVDVVWLFLFACIYVWGAGAHAGAARTDADRRARSEGGPRGRPSCLRAVSALSMARSATTSRFRRCGRACWSRWSAMRARSRW